MSSVGSYTKNEGEIPLLDIADGISCFWEQRYHSLGARKPDAHTALKQIDSYVDAHEESDAARTLIQLLTTLWRHERITGTSDSELVYMLQKKFALFGRLAAQYDSCFHKVGETYAIADDLALFAAILLVRFSRTLSLNELNSALKVIDHVLIGDIYDVSLVRAVLVLEQESVAKVLHG